MKIGTQLRNRSSDRITGVYIGRYVERPGVNAIHLGFKNGFWPCTDDELESQWEEYVPPSPVLRRYDPPTMASYACDYPFDAT